MSSRQTLPQEGLHYVATRSEREKKIVDSLSYDLNCVFDYHDYIASSYNLVVKVILRYAVLIVLCISSFSFVILYCLVHIIHEQLLPGRPLDGRHKKPKCTWSRTTLVFQKYEYFITIK